MSILIIVSFIVVIIIFVAILLVVLSPSSNPGTGQSCTTVANCNSGFICDSTTRTCAVPLGGTCGKNVNCASGTTCVNGRCTTISSQNQVITGPTTSTPTTAPRPEEIRFNPPIVISALPVPSVTPASAKATVSAIPSRPSPIAATSKKPTVLPPTSKALVPQPVPVQQTISEKKDKTIIIPGPAFSPVLESRPVLATKYIAYSDSRDEKHYSGSSDRFYNFSVRSGASSAYSGSDTMQFSSHFEPMMQYEGKIVPNKSVPDIKSVVDAISFSNMTLMLLKSGHITCQQDGQKRIIRPNVHLTNLENFSGYLYGVSSGNLYRLTNDQLSLDRWTWSPCSWAPSNIVHISTTLDRKYLYLQSDFVGQVYDSTFHKIETFEMSPGWYRNYGSNLSCYIDYSPHERKITVTDGYQTKTHGDTSYGIFNTHGKIFTISGEDIGKYRVIKLINWMPYYIE